MVSAGLRTSWDGLLIARIVSGPTFLSPPHRSGFAREAAKHSRTESELAGFLNIDLPAGLEQTS